MKKYLSLILAASFILLFYATSIAQTRNDIQGTWRMIATTLKTSDGNVFKMDSSTHNLTKTITRNRIIFTVYNRKTDSLLVSGQGKASTKGNQYIERFEQSTEASLLKVPMIFTFKVQGDQLSYEGGSKEVQIVEVLRRIE